MEPRELREGGSLTLELGGRRQGDRYEYRLGPDEPWRPAAEGRVLVKNLKPGPLTIEVRILDPRGRVSPVARKTVSVAPLPTPRPVGPGFHQGDEFFQEVVISRLSRYRVLGLDLGQDVQYTLVSRYRILKTEADGSMKVRQTVEAVRLAEADPSLRATLDDLLARTRGKTFLLTLNPACEVVSFEAGKEPLKVLKGVNPLGGPAFLVWSFLDLDGWKELAEVSFFKPREPVRKADRWTRPVRHSWGALGQWRGVVAYVHRGRQAARERYDYALDLAYRPPAPGGGVLEFEIDQAEFRVQTALGAIAFDPARARVDRAEERFHVRGALSITVLGVESVIEMDEAQLFQLRLHDRNPSDK